jgi:hypothetical protein
MHHRWPAIAVAHCRVPCSSAVPVLQHHLLLMLLLLMLQQGHVLLLRHGVPGRRGGLKHLRARMHAAAAAAVGISLVESQARHAAAAAPALLHDTHVRVAHRHAHRSAAHLGRTGEAGTSATQHVGPHHGLLWQHAAHRPTDGATTATAFLPLGQRVPAARGASLCVVRLPAAVVVSLDLHRDLVPAATLLATTALLVAPAGRRRHGHGLHHLGLVVDVVVEALVVVVLVVIEVVVVEVIVELAATVVVEAVLGEGELDGLGVVLQRRGRGERRHVAAQEVRRELQPLHLQLLLQLLELLRRRLRHHHLRILGPTTPATGTTGTLVTAATRTALLGLATAGILGMALATAGVLRLALAAAMAVLRDAGLGAPQLGRLAGLVELPDDGVRIQQAGHRHLPLFRVDAALVDTYSGKVNLHHVSACRANQTV